VRFSRILAEEFEAARDERIGFEIVDDFPSAMMFSKH
jgi:hypothetical protein